MKAKYLMTIASMMLLCCTLSAQKIKIAKDEVDKFSGNRITETKLEQLCFKNTTLGTKWHSIFLMLRKVNDGYTLPANIYLPDVEKYVEDSGLTFLTDSGKSVALNTLYTGISGPDSFYKNSFVFETAFKLSPEDVEILSSEEITDVIIRYLGNHFDIEVSDKKQDLIIRMFQAIEAAQKSK